MKFLIVEDDPNYADTLEMLVEELGYEVVAIEDNGEDAIKAFRTQQPDILLMDINIKGALTGIDLAHLFQKERVVPVIFITSYKDSDTFKKAKESTPFAYLVKPFDPDELERSVELAVQSIYGKEDNVFEERKSMLLAGDFFFVKERNKLIKLHHRDILWIEVEDKYCSVHTEKAKFVLRLSLKEIADKLDPEYFAQTHRSYIANIGKVDNFDLSQYTLTIANKEVPLGKTYKDDIISRLKLL